MATLTAERLHEARRYFSAVWIIARWAIDDDVIGTHHIRRGPRWRPDPEAFGPNRFRPSDGDRPSCPAIPSNSRRR
ncbi:hypothetical protein [Mycobacterium malmoense]|uniref:hypothetical protein n=1 Tax=Mycobacterium malmoense TaxID=1780 RepID=UPI0008F9642B|nr:hypothetical protein [Mycobacterium malmoense]OIN78576.1 hypothetical protein BMG05_22685 [Mycobacterium malmoense]